ncbi:uncharacterized protein PV07_08689 [Cladophialophora immunda]|uniref:Restriction endonuclease domain-containing protein n=1 Tax=Cladophialophora immunda TaxID=569365 RepID=A0A0D2C2W2_9EURO|nr:uncharacterized protein PV07_08689 [Cladophialophora immunda]KIW25523.1 hypothetical protein PV07_08689 [Cladophialophora immunda]
MTSPLVPHFVPHYQPSSLPPAPMLPPAPVPGNLDQLKTYVEGMKAGECGPQMDEDVEFNVSVHDWDKLCKQYDIEERVYRYTYDASKSILTLHGPPSPAHEIIVEFLRHSLFRNIDYRPTVRIATGTELIATEGEYSWSRKVPDLVILEMDPQKGWMFKMTFEIGVSQTYQKLKENVELILKGTGSVAQCILVKLTETPEYRCPLSTEARAEKAWKAPRTIEEDEFEGKGYGPIRFQGQQWVGNISEIFWEAWKLDAATNEIQLDGERQIIHPASPSMPRPDIPLGLALSDLKPEDSIKLNWDFFEAAFKAIMTNLARHRYSEWYHKTEGDNLKDKDKDYEEEDEDEEED